MSCFESLLLKIILLRNRVHQKGVYIQGQFLDFIFWHFLSTSLRLVDTNMRENNCVWWLSKFSLLVTEKCERNSKSSREKTLHVMSSSGLGTACASLQQSSRDVKDMTDILLSLGTPSFVSQMQAAVIWGQTYAEWDLLLALVLFFQTEPT